MYDNIGGKLKLLAKIVFGIDAAIAIIGGLVLMSFDEDLIFIGFIVMIIGFIIAWIFSWFLYGFGQLIENSDIITDEYRNKNKNRKNENDKTECKTSDKINPFQGKSKTADRFCYGQEELPTEDESGYIDMICPNCKEELSYTKEQLISNEILICPMCNAPIYLKK